MAHNSLPFTTVFVVVVVLTRLYMKDEGFQLVRKRDPETMLDGGLYTQKIMADPFSSMTGLITTETKNKTKRRFNDEQIKSLELVFESETRLEPRKKLEVARELGLQPRQVAIWFQNKRARWKSKRLERDYSILRANYNILASKLETVKKEKQALVIQLQKLNDLLKKPKEEGQCCEQVMTATNSIDGDSNKGTAVKSDSEGQFSISMERSEHATRIDYFGPEGELNLISMMEPADGSLTSPEDWRSFDSDGLFDQSSRGYQCGLFIVVCTIGSSCKRFNGTGWAMRKKNNQQKDK